MVHRSCQRSFWHRGSKRYRNDSTFYSATKRNLDRCRHQHPRLYYFLGVDHLVWLSDFEAPAKS